MLPTIDPSGQQFLNSLARVYSRIDDAQRQIASGRKLNEPSDDPDQVSPVLQLRAEIGMNKTVATNLGQVKTEVDAGEQTLSSSVDLLQQASVLATQATSPMQTAQTRATLADNVQSLLDQMVKNSNTTVSGRYIFGGDADQSAPYVLDLASATGATALQNAADTRQVAAPGGAAFAVSRRAADIFDARDANGNPTSGNVFAALNSLRVALAANDDAGIQSSIGNLSAASTYLNNQLAFYGETQGRVSAALTASQNDDTRLQAELSSRQDADLATQITEMQQAQTQMQAALQARAQLPRTTLFDVLRNG